MWILLQVLFDFLTVLASFVASNALYGWFAIGGAPQTMIEYAAVAALASSVYIVLLEREDLYRKEVSLLNIKELRGLFHVGLYAAAVILSASFYLRATSYSRVTLTLALVLTPLFLYLQRQLVYRVLLRFQERGWSQKRVVIYGAGATGIHLAKRFFQSPALGYLPVAFLDDDEAKWGRSIQWKVFCPQQGLPVFGGDAVLSELRSRGIATVLIAMPGASVDRNQALVSRCRALGLDYAIVPIVYGALVQEIETFEVGGIPLLRIRQKRVAFYFDPLKRLVDFGLSTFFILISLPVTVLIALAIRWDSVGPIFFKQKRVGYNGKEFTLYKFRSMHTHAERYARTPSNAEDPRITRVGRWLRRTSLDELPQLFNVFRGDMSLVGPRPEMPFIVANYNEQQRQRLGAKPGITGVWQISAARSEPIHENLEYDLFYLENRSLLLDLAIIAKTILSVVRGIGAY